MSTPNGDVQAVQYFYLPPADGSAPHFRVTSPSGVGVRNYFDDPHEVHIGDMRHRESGFTPITMGLSL
jgi:hypothetical protein